MENCLNNTHRTIPLRNRFSSCLPVDDPIGLEQSQIYGVMLVSALVCNNFAYAQALEAIIRKTANEKIIDIAKSAANHAGVKKNQDFSSLFLSDNVETDFLIYLLAAFFICRFGSYVKLNEKLQQYEIIDEPTIYEVIRIAGTVQTVSKLHKIESEPKKKILVVDDEVDMTRLLKLTLEKIGDFEVRTENKGSNAVAAARAFKPDLILLDIIMPDMGGEDVAARIREDKELSEIKIVFLTGLLNNDETGDANTKIGKSMLLAKPIRGNDLINCIENQINNSLMLTANG